MNQRPAKPAKPTAFLPPEKCMRAFAEAWPETVIVQRPVAQLTGARKPESAIVQAPLAQLRWYVTKLVDSLPKALKGAVPSVAELEKGLTSKTP
jgi:hypothetical protein